MLKNLQKKEIICSLKRLQDINVRMLLDKSNDFFDELPQFIQKDPVYFKILNYIFSVLISNDVRVKSWVDSLSSDMNEQDFRVVTELVKGVMTPEMLKN